MPLTRNTTFCRALPDARTARAAPNRWFQTSLGPRARLNTPNLGLGPPAANSHVGKHARCTPLQNEEQLPLRLALHSCSLSPLTARNGSSLCRRPRCGKSRGRGGRAPTGTVLGGCLAGRAANSRVDRKYASVGWASIVSRHSNPVRRAVGEATHRHHAPCDCMGRVRAERGRDGCQTARTEADEHSRADAPPPPCRLPLPRASPMPVHTPPSIGEAMIGGCTPPHMALRRSRPHSMLRMSRSLRGVGTRTTSPSCREAEPLCRDWPPFPWPWAMGSISGYPPNPPT